METTRPPRPSPPPSRRGRRSGPRQAPGVDSENRSFPTPYTSLHEGGLILGVPEPAEA